MLPRPLSVLGERKNLRVKWRFPPARRVNTRRAGHAVSHSKRKDGCKLARLKQTAVVFCQGGGRAKWKPGEYPAFENCRQALESVPEGLLDCPAGCIGLGSCVAACRLNAIHIGASGLPVVNRTLCVGCGLCAKACPQSLIRLRPADMPIQPLCSTRLPNAKAVRDACASGCISCRLCEKNCPVGAITIQEGHAVIDPDRCVSCGMCAVKCPRGVILDADGIFTVRPDAKEG